MNNLCSINAENFAVTSNWNNEVPFITPKVKRLHPDAKLPVVAHGGYRDNAGADVHAIEDVVIPPFTSRIAQTGLAVELPPGFEIQVRCRSGMAIKAIMVANGVGTVDASYRGQIGVILYNGTTSEYTVKKGDRIGQFVLASYIGGNWTEVDELSETTRGIGGFGSTGK